MSEAGAECSGCKKWRIDSETDMMNEQIIKSAEKPGLVVLTGPTAVGKTALSIRLARAIKGEIISADSMQVYRGMDIGSAKIREEEKEGIPHHLIDVLDPEESFDVVRFQSMAKEAARKIRAAGHIPIVTGGTGFYIQALLYDIDFTENDADRSFRDRLEAIAETEDGPALLHRMLEEADPESAALIHENNIKRTIRALEFNRQTGQKISVHNEQERARTSPYNFAYFVLNDDREKVYDRINRRVDLMMEEGLEAEVGRLHEKGLKRDMVSMQGLGYREMLAYLDGETDREEAVRLIKRNTRHFAKRQLTWFRREKDVIWMNRQDYPSGDSAILEEMIRILEEKGIISRQA